MQKLQDKLDAAKKKEQQLTDDYETADRKCNRAKSLKEKLKDEEVSWKISLDKNGADKHEMEMYMMECGLMIKHMEMVFTVILMEIFEILE